MPPHVAEIDRIVCSADAPRRQVLIVYYVQQGTMSEKARRIGIPRTTFFDRLRSAESFVAINL